MSNLKRLIRLSVAALVASFALEAQEPAAQDPGPYLGVQPTAELPARPTTPLPRANPEARLAQEERDARFLMDLQIQNQVRNAQSAEVQRSNQEKASAALREYYTRMLEPSGPQAPAGAASFQQPSGQSLSLQGLQALQGIQPQGSGPSPIPAVGQGRAATGGAPNSGSDGHAGEDGPTVARKKRLGFLPKGSIVDIRLLTRVNTSISGPVLGEVIYDVWDVDQRYILIPRGSKAVGASSQMGSDTESGGKVVFDTFVDPSGREIPIAIPVVTASRIGVTGVPGRVDYHWGRVFGGSLALAVITGITGSGNQPAGNNQNMTQADVMRQNLMTQTGQVSNGLLNRFIQTKPDVTLEEGTNSKVIILQAMLIKPYQKVF